MKIGVYLTALLALSGCTAGDVEMSEIEEFGNVRSASWTNSYDFASYRLTSSGTLEGYEARYDHRIALYDAEFKCEDQRQYMALRDQATRDLLAASSDGTDAQAVCDGMATLLDKYVEADESRSGFARQIIFQFQDEAALDESSYNITFSSSSPSADDAFGNVYYFDESFGPGEYYRTRREAWDPSICAFDFNTIDADPDNESAQWSMSGGTIDLKDVEFETAISGTFDANIVDGSSSPAGSASGTFEATFCDDSGDYKFLSL